MPSTVIEQLSEDAITLLVNEFYARIRKDDVLAPVFAHAIPGDWEPHLQIMRNFWSSVMLTSGRYKGNPVAKHKRLEGVELDMFKRWLALFDETCRDMFTPAIAAEFKVKAERIAESLKLAMFYRPDRPWPPQDALKA